MWRVKCGVWKQEKKKEQNDKRTFIYLFIRLFSWPTQEERKCLRRGAYDFKSSQQLDRKKYAGEQWELDETSRNVQER